MIAVIAAYAHRRIIGSRGRIPWRIPGEQRQFRNLTMGKSVVMGRVTYEEIGRPLPGRNIYVVSRNSGYHPEGVTVVGSLQEAIRQCAADLYIAGGQLLFEEGIKLADRLYLTEIDLETEGDRYFPELPEHVYTCISKETVDGEIPYCRYVYERNAKGEDNDVF